MDNPVQPQTSRTARWHIPMPTALFLLVVAVVVVGAMSLFQDFWLQRARTGHIQAVFLSNGQVYFGKMTTMTRDEVVLDQVYYLQSATTLQQGSTNANTNTSAAPEATGTPTQFSIVKLGGEVHGPTDRMYISRSQILFTEDLRDDSQVVRIIRGQ